MVFSAGSVIIVVYKNLLVGGLSHFLFFHILGLIIPTDFHFFQRGGSTTNQLIVGVVFPVADGCRQCMFAHGHAGNPLIEEFSHGGPGKT